MKDISRNTVIIVIVLILSLIVGEISRSRQKKLAQESLEKAVLEVVENRMDVYKNEKYGFELSLPWPFFIVDSLEINNCFILNLADTVSSYKLMICGQPFVSIDYSHKLMQAAYNTVEYKFSPIETNKASFYLGEHCCYSDYSYTEINNPNEKGFMRDITLNKNNKAMNITKFTPTQEGLDGAHFERIEQSIIVY